MKKISTLLLSIFLVLSFFNNSTAQQSFAHVQDRYYEDLRYGVMVPPNYDSTQLYPLVVDLHCSGCVGWGNIKWFMNTAYQTTYPCFIFAPQCPLDYGNWGFNGDTTFTKPIRLAMEVLDSLIAEFPIDTNRLYIHGKSMGGFGTINVISKQPGRFAAAYSECGGGYPVGGLELSQTPLWLFHGSDDANVPVDASRGLYYEILNTGGTKVRYTEFPGYGHEISFQVDNTPRLNEWIFAQDKSVQHGAPDAAGNFTVTQIDNWTAAMSWAAPDPALKNDNRTWYFEVLRDGVVLDTLDASVTSYVDSNLTENHDYTYEIRTTNLFFESSLTDEIVFGTTLDVTPPEIVTAEVYESGLTESKIFITFDEKMTEASSENPANYSLSGGLQVLSANLLADKQNVILTTSPLRMNEPYDLIINNVEDSSITKNKIAAGTEIQVESKQWLTAHIGTWLNPGSAEQDDNTVTLSIEGDYSNPVFSGNILYANKHLESDDTLSVRINQVEASDVNFRAGIMLRSSLDPESECFAISVSRSRLYVTSREGNNFSDNTYRGINLPGYLRIIKSTGRLSVYTSSNGTDWGSPIETSDDFLGNEYFAGLFATPLNGGNVTAVFDNIDFPLVTSVSGNEEVTPVEYSLSNNYPNPFNPVTTISYTIPEDANVKVEVFDMLSQKIATLVDGYESSGTYNIKWNAGNLSSGIYYIRFRAEGSSGKNSFEKTQKALLMK